jgi:hypothetical protein
MLFISKCTLNRSSFLSPVRILSSHLIFPLPSLLRPPWLPSPLLPLSLPLARSSLPLLYSLLSHIRSFSIWLSDRFARLVEGTEASDLEALEKESYTILLAEAYDSLFGIL